MRLAKTPDAAQQIASFVRQHGRRRPQLFRLPLQLLVHDLLIAFAHRQDGDRLQVLQFEAFSPPRLITPPQAGDDQTLLLADLDDAIGRPNPIAGRLGTF